MKNKITDLMIASLFLLGLLLAGSDGAAFPVPNIIGVVLILAFAFLANVALKNETSRASRKRLVPPKSGTANEVRRCF